MATLNVQVITRSGLNPSFLPAEAGGDQFANAGNVFHVAKNDDTVAHTVTYITTKTEDGLELANRPVIVPPGEQRWTGGFQKDIYNGPTGNVQVTYDSVTGMTGAAISFTPVI
jgi:hypothetical protein